jgi:nucleotide-binding universal stress UspA family protein
MIPTLGPDGGAGRMKMKTNALLVVIDESDASKRAVNYVASLVGRRRGFRLCLTHLLPRLPPGLLEFAGTEDPHEESRLDARLKARQRRWVTEARKRAQRVLARANTVLHRAGVPERTLGVQMSEGVMGHSAADRILELARRRRCHTVVIGRKSVSWFRELVRGDLSEELVRRGQGVTIWVVE